MTDQEQHLETLKDIKKMMQRSSRFISLSGLSGIAAGIWALAGAWFAYTWISEYDQKFWMFGEGTSEFRQLKLRLFLLAGGVVVLAFISALFFTLRRAGRHNQKLWDHSSRQLLVNTAIPIVAGGLMILAMLQQGDWGFVAPGSLIFYGLGLVSGSRYTLSDIRYLGFTEILLGLVNTQYIGYGLYFWAAGFGLLHIIYGFVMWWKYERRPATED